MPVKLQTGKLAKPGKNSHTERNKNKSREKLADRLLKRNTPAPETAMGQLTLKAVKFSTTCVASGQPTYNLQKAAQKL